MVRSEGRRDDFSDHSLLQFMYTFRMRRKLMMSFSLFLQSKGRRLQLSGETVGKSHPNSSRPSESAENGKCWIRESDMTEPCHSHKDFHNPRDCPDMFNHSRQANGKTAVISQSEQTG
jgi:hypothetical protein